MPRQVAVTAAQQLLRERLAGRERTSIFHGLSVTDISMTIVKRFHVNNSLLKGAKLATQIKGRIESCEMNIRYVLKPNAS